MNRCFVPGLIWISLFTAADAADMDKLLTGNMEAYSGTAVPMVDVTAKGNDPQQSLAIVYDGRFSNSPYVGWKPGEEVDVVIDLRGQRVIKGVHIRFKGDISGVELSYSVDRAEWHYMDAEFATYPNNVTWLEALDFAAPARYLRLLGTAGDAGLAISNTRVYGADEIGQVDLVDGVYATPAPAVAGTSVGLNVIIANTSSGPLDNLHVKVSQEEPTSHLLGEHRRKTLAPHRSMMFKVPWDPVKTEPHRIVVAVHKQHATEAVETSVTLPVVDRRLWFGSAYRWATFEGPTNINFSTPYRVENNPGLIRMLKRRGGYYLRGAMTANTGGKKDAELLAADFVNVMDLSDGVCIDEYLTAPEETVAIDVAALTRARQERPDKIIAPWTTGTDYALELFQTTADVVLLESYMTIYGPKNYEDRFGDQIKSLRKYGILNRAILVQGIFGDRNRQMSAEDLENSIRFVRHTAPEVPGMGGYGGWIRGPTAEVYRLCDELCYKYFIAPVVTMYEDPVPRGRFIEVKLRNIGGMHSPDVQVAAFDSESGQELGRSAPIGIPAGERGFAEAVIMLPDVIGNKMPRVMILPSDGYTVLEYLPPVDLHRRNREEDGGIDVARVGFIPSDPEGTAPVPDDAWVSEDQSPQEARDDYHQLSGGHPRSAVLDLGAARTVTRIECRGYPHFADLAEYAEFIQGLRVLVSDDNVTYTPAAAGYESRHDAANRLIIIIDGLQARGRYLKINSTHPFGGKGYWMPKAPDDMDALYKAGAGGLIGWDVYLAN